MSDTMTQTCINNSNDRIFFICTGLFRINLQSVLHGLRYGFKQEELQL